MVNGNSATQTVNVSVAGKQELRLVVNSNGDISYDHADWAGARLMGGGSSGGASLGIDAATNRMVATDGSIGYDAAGNLIRGGRLQNATYEYDANNRMRRTVEGSFETLAVYDGAGRRVQTTEGGVTKHHIYDVFGRAIAEYEPSGGGWKRDDIYIDRQLLAMEMVGGAQRYVFSDHLGSTRVVMDGGGAIILRRDYQPFGEELRAGHGMRTGAQGFGGSDPAGHDFAMMERSEVTSLDHTLWRKYDPWAGRWTSPDPDRGNSIDITNPQSWNRYTYVENDPVNFIDPDGLFLGRLFRSIGRFFSRLFGRGGGIRLPGGIEGGLGFVPLIPIPNPTLPRCRAEVPDDPDRRAAIATILGEATPFGRLGQREYALNQSGRQAVGNRRGELITLDSLNREKRLIASVLVNRVSNGFGTSLLAVASARSQFIGYAEGVSRLAAYQLLPNISEQCQQLYGAIQAVDDVLRNGVEDPNVLYFKAVVQGRPAFVRRFEQGVDIDRVADTDFSVSN